MGTYKTNSSFLQLVDKVCPQCKHIIIFENGLWEHSKYKSGRLVKSKGICGCMCNKIIVEMYHIFIESTRQPVEVNIH